MQRCIKQKTRTNLRNIKIIALFLGVIPPISYSAKPILLSSLLSVNKPSEPWDLSVLIAQKTVYFSQADSAPNANANQITKVTLSYFIDSECSGTLSDGNLLGSYTTPNTAQAFDITLNTPFGLNAASTWGVGANQLGIGSMEDIQSIAVTFYSTNNGVPQSNFSQFYQRSFACIA